MALIGNQTVFNKTFARSIGGNATSHASGIGGGSCIQFSRHTLSDWRKFNLSDQAGTATFVDTVKTAAKPTGYYPQGAWRLPNLVGEMAARISGDGEVTGAGLLGLLMLAALTGSGTAGGTAVLRQELIAALTGSGTVSGAIVLRADLLAALTGSGDVDGSIIGVVGLTAALTGNGALSGTIVTRLSMLADLLGSGSVDATLTAIGVLNAALSGSGTASGAIARRLPMAAALQASGDVDGTLQGIADLLATLVGTGAVTGSTMTGVGFMSANITSAGSALTAASIADAVWDEAVASHSIPGSTGEALAAAGSAGDPWITTLPGSYASTQAGGILYIIRQILKNKQKTDPATGVMTVYADDGTTVLFTADVFNDADGDTPYDGTAGINSRDALE